MKARSAALAVIDTGTGLLLQRREIKDGIWWPGKLGCWGGHVELSDESPYDALVRELFEELELSPEELEITHLKTLTEDFTETSGAVSRLTYHYFVVKLLDPSRFLHVYEGSGAEQVPYDVEVSDARYSLAPNAVYPLELLRRSCAA